MRKLLYFLQLILVAWLAQGVAAADSDGRDLDVKSGPLFETIARMDRHLCAAFNAHDVDRMMSMTTKDLEFYQDNDGLKGYQQCYDDFKRMFAASSDIQRELIDSSIEVYPIKDYGALEIGQHRFCHTENGKKECGVFKFTMLWQKSEDSWKVARVISYGHQ
jgi:ketosteroid isomerase-like protein